MNRKMRLPSGGGRDSLQPRSSMTGGSASKLPRSTPLLHSSKKVLPSTSQKSMKRSSYFGSSDHHMMKEMRPLNDKSYMKKCVMELLAFLSDMNYPNPLSAKMLMPPTNKDYFRIVEFTYSLLSPNYSMIARPDEETSKILSDLNYPYSLSRSTLSNIGTMSAWPHALGALHWLVGLVKYSMEVETDELSYMLYKGERKQELFLDYLQDTYTAFMHGQNEPYDDINKQLNSKIEMMNKDQLGEIEDLKIKARQLRIRREELSKEKDDINEMEQRLTSMQQDKKHFQEYFEQFSDYCKSLENKYQVLEVKYAEIKEIASSLESEVQELQSTVSGQELSMADVQKLQIEKGQLENNIKAMEERGKELEEQYWEKQIERSKMIEKVSSQITEYIGICSSLLLIPETAANADGIDYSLKAEYSDVQQNVEKLIGVIRPRLMQMKSEFLAASGKLQRERNHIATKIEQFKEQVSDQERIKVGLQEQFSKMKDEEEKQTMEFERMEETQTNELHRVKEDIESLKTVNTMSVDDIESQLKQEREKFRESEIKRSKEKDDFTDFLLQLSEKCLDQKTRIRKKFEEFNKTIREMDENYETQMKSFETEVGEMDKKALELQRVLETLKKDNPPNCELSQIPITG